MATIRQQVNIAVPARTVWNALTTVEGLTSWWADEARIDARQGGVIVITTEGDDGAPMEERGILHEITPTRRIEIKWDAHGKAPSAGTRLTFNVARDGAETRLSIVHTGGGALDDEAARSSLDKDWNRALKGLRDALEGNN